MMRTLVFLVLAGCGGRADRPHGTPDVDTDSITDVGSDTGSDTGTGIGPVPLRVDVVVPGHGPTAGGNSVEIRGDGFGGPFFAADVVVRFGDDVVPAPDFEIISPRSLRVLRVPAGAVGPTDVGVSTTFDGDPPQNAVLPGGYVYDSFWVDPSRGSIGGGTRVGLYGLTTVWDEAAVVTFDGAPAVSCEVLGPLRIDCQTPPGEPGDADVRVTDGSGEGRYDDFVEDAFTYYEAADPIGGGLGGGPIDGQVNVTVLNRVTARPIEDAFVMLGADPATPHQGRTNALGQIVFDDDALRGNQVVTAGADDYEWGTFAEFDARDVTIFLTPYPSPGPPDGFVRQPSTIRGELVFEGPNEFGPNPWVIVPDPVDPDEHKECHVSTTSVDLFRENPDSGPGYLVTEDEINPEGRGYPYAIASRPAALAVFAVCGLFNWRTAEFLPYAMGAARNVIVPPEDTVSGVDIVIDIPLDHLAIAELEDTPVEGEAGPDHYRADVYLDLGGEGLIEREDKSVWSIDPDADFRFPAQAPLVGTISDARWLLVGGAYTGEADGIPESVVVLRGLHDTIDPIVLGDFVGVPVVTEPAFGALVEDGHVAWEAPGGLPTFTAFIVTKPGIPTIPVWEIFVRGGVTDVTLPDLSAIGGIPQPPDGLLTAAIIAPRVPAIGFDDFSYTYMNGRYWDAWADDVIELSMW